MFKSILRQHQNKIEISWTSGTRERSLLKNERKIDKKEKDWYSGDVKNVYRVVMGIIMGFVVSSCAYMQTHKNVEEVGSYYAGHLLRQQDMQLYRAGEKWYLAAYPAKFRLKYPVVYDSVFRRKNSAPHFQLINYEQQLHFHEISPSAAKVLMRPDGYFRMDALVDNIKKNSGEWISHLPAGASRLPVHAELSGHQSQSIEEKRVPSKKTLLGLTLGKIDFIIVDVPGTLAYNVAIPFMAPFVFFYEFSTEH